MKAKMNYLKNRKLILSDLDGTLLNDDGQISQYSINVINKIIKKGHIFCIATGRPWRSSKYVYDKLKLNTIIANLNGSILTKPNDKNFLPINLTFSNQILKEILNIKEVKKYLGNILVENFEGSYLITNEENDIIDKEFLEKFHINEDTNLFRIKEDQVDIIKMDLNSILIHLVNKEKVDLLSFKIKSLAETLIVRSWSISSDTKGIVIEINSIFSNKGTALKFLSSFYAIPLSSCMAFGDGENDLEMLRTISNGYALKNSSYIIKLSSHKITKYDNNNHGVAKELEKEFRLKK